MYESGVCKCLHVEALVDKSPDESFGVLDK